MKQEFKLAPYGEPSFVTLRESGYAYVDKTAFIQTLEHCGTRFPFILRPRRFGKSVFADMLMAYYDKASQNEFVKNFSGTWIGEHPTSFASKYLILKFDFSGVDGQGEELESNFMRCVKGGIRSFIRWYFPDNVELKAILKAPTTTPAGLLTDFMDLVEDCTDDKIYIIIDEYDQFAQNILAADVDKFRSMTGSGGFLKAFYAVIKKYTSSIVYRVFITGVTSISLDSMTSGFNIATNISNDADVAGMLGFTEDELRKLIPQIVNVSKYGHSVDDIFARMKILYDGYRFSPNSKTTVFNSSMCLYYLRAIANSNSEPEVLLDPSFSMDLSKIDDILSLCKNKAFIERVVEDVLFDRPVKSLGISPAINLNATTGLSNRDVLTALVFMGFLTFSSESSGQLVCPNHAVKELFFQYWFWRIEQLQELGFPVENQKEKVAALLKGDVRPLMEFVSETLSNSVGVHALSYLNEVAIQMATHMAVNTNSVYKVTAEEEALGVGFTDLILRPNERHPEAAGWVIEFKYLKKSEATPAALDAKLAEAEEQLKRYSSAQNIANIQNLHRAAVVFSGTELKRVKVF